MPDRSGLPSAVRGADAAKFGRPSGRRGTPGVLKAIHCAVTGTDNATSRAARSEAAWEKAARVLIGASGRDCILCAMKNRFVALIALLVALSTSYAALAQRKIELMPGAAGIPVAPRGLWPNGTGKKLPTTPMMFDTAEG